MSHYRRNYVPGATFFFTVVIHRRRPILTEPLGRSCLRAAIETIQAKRPFNILAVVLLPDHLHTLWALPEGDTDYSSRWRRIKEQFTRSYLQTGGTEADRSASRHRRRERGVWQRRFWEHTIRDEDDLARHLDYIHYNPVKHGLVTCPRDWPYSSFQRWVKLEVYAPDWGCPERGELTFEDLDETAME